MSQNSNNITQNEQNRSITEAQVIQFALGDNTALDNSSINENIINDATEGFKLWQVDESNLKSVNASLHQSLNTIIHNNKDKKKRRTIPKLNLTAIIAAAFIVLTIIIIWLFMQHTHAIKW